MDVENVERRLLRIIKILQAQNVALILKRESIDDLVIDHIREINTVLQDYKKVKELVSDEICQSIPSKLPLEGLYEVLERAEELVPERLEYLEDYSHLNHSKGSGMLEVIKDLHEATKIFKRRIRRKMDREKQDKADATEGTSVA